MRVLGFVLVAVVALYLVGRGVAELFTIHYSDAASYSHDWGGPSLPGVLAVHTGPALVVVVGAAVLLWRHQKARAR